MATLFTETSIKSKLRQVMAEICKEAHAMQSDDEKMTDEELQSTLRFIEGNLDDFEDQVTEWVTDALINNQ